MEFTMKLEADNAAFDDDNAAPEVARILRELADRLEDHLPVRGDTFVLRDINGNKVGGFKRSR